MGIPTANQGSESVTTSGIGAIPNFPPHHDRPIETVNHPRGWVLVVYAA